MENMKLTEQEGNVDLLKFTFDVESFKENGEINISSIGLKSFGLSEEEYKMLSELVSAMSKILSIGLLNSNAEYFGGAEGDKFGVDFKNRQDKSQHIPIKKSTLH